MSMTFPGVSVAFRAAADKSISRGRHGVVALILRDTAATEKPMTFILSSDRTVPEGVGKDTQEAVRLAWLGGVDKPRQVLVYVQGKSTAITSGCAALKWLALQHFDFVAGHGELSGSEAKVLGDWVKEQRATQRATCVAVLPSYEGKDEGIINFDAADIKVGGKTYTAAQYCGRIAGLLAGTPDTMSATFAPLPEVEDVKRMAQPAADSATAAGKLIAVYDGQKVKLGRAVNSLTNPVSPKTEDWKKIRIVAIKDRVIEDVTRTVEDQYIGKVQNTYDGKIFLIVAVRDYLHQLEQAGMLSDGTCNIDVAAQRKWLEEQGAPGVAEMDDEAVSKANTGSHVFIELAFAPVDAMEDVHVSVEMGGKA